MLYSHLHTILVWLNNHVYAIPMILVLMLCIFLGIMSLYFLKLTGPSFRYFQDIHNNITQISHGDLSLRIPVKSHDELGDLADVLNEMTRQINDLIYNEKQMSEVQNQLVTNVSHDLRTPLTSILGYLDLLKSEIHDEKLREHYLNIIDNKSQHLKQLIDQLFEYTKLNSGQLPIDKVNVNLEELIEQVLLGFLPTLSQENLTYTIESEEVYVHVDPTLMARLFENLISNSIQYGKDGKHIHLELHETKGTAHIVIKNYGQAISKEDLPFIFTRLYRGNSCHRESSSGSGLGLAIVKSIVDLHNGQISVHSTTKETSFHIHIPMK